LACRQILQQWSFLNTGHRYVQTHHSTRILPHWFSRAMWHKYFT
jgi:hypothetical protein